MGYNAVGLTSIDYSLFSSLLLGRIAALARCGLLLPWSACVCWLLVTTVNVPAKTAEPIEMTFATGAHFCGPKDACIRWRRGCTLRQLANTTEYSVCVRRCGLMLIYFDHLLLLQKAASHA